MAAVLDQLALATYAAMDTQLNMATLSQESALLNNLQKRRKLEHGKTIDVKARYKRVNGGSYEGSDTRNTERVEQFFAGSINWKKNDVVVTINEDDLVRNAGTNIPDLIAINDFRRIPKGTQKTLINLLAKEFMGGFEDLNYNQCVQLWGDGTGNSGKDITGLRAIASTTLAYAGISVSELSTFEWLGEASGVKDNIWATKQLDLSSATVTPDDIGTMINDITRGRLMKIEIYMPMDIWLSLEMQLEGDKLREGADAELGFQRIRWPRFNAELFPDPEAPANTIIGFAEKHVEYLVNPGMDYLFSGFLQPTDQHTITGYIQLMSQLRCDDRAKTFKIINANP